MSVIGYLPAFERKRFIWRFLGKHCDVFLSFLCIWIHQAVISVSMLMYVLNNHGGIWFLFVSGRHGELMPEEQRLIAGRCVKDRLFSSFAALNPLQLLHQLLEKRVCGDGEEEDSDHADCRREEPTGQCLLLRAPRLHLWDSIVLDSCCVSLGFDGWFGKRRFLQEVSRIFVDSLVTQVPELQEFWWSNWNFFWKSWVFSSFSQSPTHNIRHISCYYRSG